MPELRIPDLAGKVFLLTGASTGIGAAVARALGAQGAQLAVHYHRSRSEAEAVAADVTEAGGGAFLVSGDLSHPEEAAGVVERAAAHFGRIEGLINNAGALLGRKPIEESDIAHDRLVLDLNAVSLVAACRAALPWLRRQGGVIINTTSIAARTGGGGGSVIYASSKAFVSAFTHGFAKEVVGDRIRVNGVAPGVILTPFHERFSSAAQMEAMVGTIPMRRAGTAEECVGAYLYLASEMLSGYVTGQILEVNGGQYMP